MDELIYASAEELAEEIQDQEVSSEEVVEAHPRRIEAVNHHTNAVVFAVGGRAVDEAQGA